MAKHTHYKPINTLSPKLANQDLSSDSPKWPLQASKAHEEKPEVKTGSGHFEPEVSKKPVLYPDESFLNG